MPRTLAWLAAAAIICTALLTWAHGDAFHAPIHDLAAGAADVTVVGAENDLGDALATGDFNGDGIDDLLLGAPREQSETGVAYIVFGSPTISGTKDLAQLDGNVAIVGIDDNDRLADSVAAGDFNGDGFDDALLGAPGDDGFPDARSNAGGAYVVFGSANMSGVIQVTGLQHRLRVVGATEGDNLGYSVAAGDLNDDGVGDLVLGAWDADGPADARVGAGEAYVIYGSPSLGGIFDLSTQQPGLLIIGAAADDNLGSAVTTGDFDDNGRDDVLVGAPGANGSGGLRDNAGEAYVVFTPDMPGVADMSLGQHELRVIGGDANDLLGYGVAAGDFNADGRDDVLLGAESASGDNNARSRAGEAYVIYASDDWGVSDLALGEHNLRIIGADPDDVLSIESVAAGDFNGDGRDDVLVGAPGADGPNNSRTGAGEAFVIYGDAGWAVSDMALDEYDLRIIGADKTDILGYAVTTGDFNDDGLEDVLVSAVEADGVDNTRPEAGEAYVIFGVAPPTPTPTPSPSPTPSPTPSATPTASPTPGPVRIQGDVNCDGTVNDGDFEDLIEYAAGLFDGSMPDPCPDLDEAFPSAITAHPWGDVNCDDAVNALDSLYVLAYTVAIDLPPLDECRAIGNEFA